MYMWNLSHVTLRMVDGGYEKGLLPSRARRQQTV